MISNSDINYFYNDCWMDLYNFLLDHIYVKLFPPMTSPLGAENQKALPDPFEIGDDDLEEGHLDEYDEENQENTPPHESDIALDESTSQLSDVLSETPSAPPVPRKIESNRVQQVPIVADPVLAQVEVPALIAPTAFYPIPDVCVS